MALKYRDCHWINREWVTIADELSGTFEDMFFDGIYVMLKETFEC